MMCDYCEKEKDLEGNNEDFSMAVDETGIFSVFWRDPNDFHHITYDETQFNYCPICGKKFNKSDHR